MIFIINRPDKDKPLTWELSNEDFRLAIVDILSLKTDFNYIDKVEITMNDNVKAKSNSKNYAFPDKYV